MEIEQRLHKFAKARGLSLRKVAQAAGFSESMIWYYEKHIEAMPLGRAVNMAKVLGVTLEQLLGENEYCRSKEIMQLKRDNAKLRNALLRVRQHLQNECGDIVSDLFPERKGENA